MKKLFIALCITCCLLFGSASAEEMVGLHEDQLAPLCSSIYDDKNDATYTLVAMAIHPNKESRLNYFDLDSNGSPDIATFWVKDRTNGLWYLVGSLSVDDANEMVRQTAQKYHIPAGAILFKCEQTL